MKNTISVGEVIDKLNALLELDPEAANKLFEMNIPFTNPEVEFLTDLITFEGRFSFLNLLNYLFGLSAEGMGQITAQVGIKQVTILKNIIKKFKKRRDYPYDYFAKMPFSGYDDEQDT